AGRRVLPIGLLIGGLALGLGTWYFNAGRAAWQTMVFTVLAFAQVGQALAARSDTERLTLRRLRGNAGLTFLALLVVALQVAVVYTPGVNAFFGVQALGALDLAAALAAGAVVLAVLEALKRPGR
ncbi:MAG: cation-translocating P-type ATPase C-terminal domain-containing protein, partial [Acidimicrobiia bacterium]|nr:cation-translocating P-type ATPase C-terminal domain-containing protein [Acidimicrobiia bacterium]